MALGQCLPALPQGLGQAVYLLLVHILTDAQQAFYPKALHILLLTGIGSGGDGHPVIAAVPGQDILQLLLVIAPHGAAALLGQLRQPRDGAAGKAVDGVQVHSVHPLHRGPQGAVFQLGPLPVQVQNIHRNAGGQLRGGGLGAYPHRHAHQVVDIHRPCGNRRQPGGHAGVHRRHRPQTFHRLFKHILPIVGRIGHIARHQAQVDLSRGQSFHIHGGSCGRADVHLHRAVRVGDGLGNGAANGIHGPPAVRRADGQHRHGILFRFLLSACGPAAGESQAQSRRQQQSCSPYLFRSHKSPFRPVSLLSASSSFFALLYHTSSFFHKRKKRQKTVPRRRDCAAERF